jgi:hypothetical protein
MSDVQSSASLTSPGPLSTHPGTPDPDLIEACTLACQQLIDESQAPFQVEPFLLTFMHWEFWLKQLLTMASKLLIGKTYNRYPRVPLTTCLLIIKEMVLPQIQLRVESVEFQCLALGVSLSGYNPMIVYYCI